MVIESPWEMYTPVGTTVEIHAWVVSGGPVDTWVWSWGSGVMDGPPSSTGDSSTSRGHFNSPGRYSVWVSAYGEGGSDDARTYVWNVDVVIDTPSSFPAYVALGQSLALGCTPLGATGGSFGWSKVIGPGNVTFTPTIGTEDPSFSADQAGNYTVQVLYSKGATVSDTSGTIRVVEVNDVISSKTVACIGENVTFGALTYPPNCAPYVTITWSGGQNPATGSGSQWATNWTTPGPKTVIATCGTSSAQKNVTIVAVDKVKVEYPPGSWDDVTGETIVVLKGTRYTFKAFPNPPTASWPSNTPNWSGAATGTGETIPVTFGSSGSQSLTAKCGSADTGKTVTINVVAPTVYQVGFGGDHTLYMTPTANGGWADGTAVITDPVYDSEIGDNNSVCVTKNSNSVSLTNVKLKVTQSLSYGTTIRVDAAGTEDWNESTDVSFSGTTSGQTSLGITGNIINQVETYAGGFQNQWKYKVPSGTDTWYPVGATSHTVYVTWGAPSGSSVTEKRVAFVCNAANGIGGTNISVPADAVFSSLSGLSFDLSGPMWGPSPIWLLHDPNQSSQCPGLADYVDKHFQMLGLGGGTIRYCRAKPDGTYAAESSPVGAPTRTLPFTGHPSPTLHDDYNPTETLIHWDGSTPPGANNYEATCLFNNYHYALGVGKFTTAKDVVTSAFTSISWEYVALDSPGPPPTYKWSTCTDVPWVEAP